MNQPTPSPSTAPMSDEKLKQVMKAIEFVVTKFRFERFVYLGMSGLSVAILLFAIGNMLLRNDKDMPSLAALFGSSGLIAVSMGRILTIWNQVIKLLLQGMS